MRLLSCLFPFSGFPPARGPLRPARRPRGSPTLPAEHPAGVPSTAAGTGGIHPLVSSRKEAGQPSTQPSAPGGSSCGGLSGLPPPLLSGTASPQVGDQIGAGERALTVECSMDGIGVQRRAGGPVPAVHKRKTNSGKKNKHTRS